MQDHDSARWPPIPAPALAGSAPDYVALVIEWGDTADQDVARVIQQPATSASPRLRQLGGAVGALGVLLLARWGIRRLRAA